MNNNKTSMPTHQHNKKINKPFNIAKAPLKATMNNPDFVKLTAAEKLNDSEYRSLVYRTYPNEPTCGCTPTNGQRSSNALLTINDHQKNSSGNFLLKCPGGCKSSCCSSLRRPFTINNGNNVNDDNKRIRGGDRASGSSIEKMYQKNSGAIEIECTNHNTRCQYVSNSSYAATFPRFTDHSPESCAININELNNNSVPEYWSPDELIGETKENGDDNEWENLDFEIDRFVHAFDDAQKFVDSLGKVPGLVGLGLVNPEKSLDFQANRENVNKKLPESKDNPMNLPIINSHIKSTTASTSPWIKDTPFTISVPGRGGIVREAILPAKRIEESKDIIEETTVPCGEVNCKSRRKIIKNHEASLNEVEKMRKFDEVVEQYNSKRKSKYDKITKRKRRKMFMGLHGDGIYKSKKSRKANYVYLAGETYPGFIYGHKNCNDQPGRVPAHMGWHWTQYQPVGRLKPRIGWRPGAISRQIREIIQEAKIGMERNRRRRRTSSVSSIGMRGRKMKTQSHSSFKKGHGKKQDEDIEELEPPPTLHIQRRDGAYYITMYPIRQETMNVPKLEEPIKPLQFTIPKNLDDNSDISSSSTASDMEIEFSPPAAVNRYKKQPNVIHVETQVKQQDIYNAFKPVFDNKEMKEKMELKKIKNINKKVKKK